ncbi:MAG: alpha-2-macroglobulin family protein [Methylobacteriaceae bacterium]|nr:alpha-2-macroglobulin family protein [Methylobacteriaceae bacterium]
MRGFFRSLLVLSLLAFAAPASAQKSFVREDLASDVVRLEETLKRESRRFLQQGKTAEQLRAEAQASAAARNYAGALTLWGAAVATNPKDAQLWLNFARASIPAEKPETYANYALRERATQAAYAAYQRFTQKSDEAAALATMAEIYARREIWRPALDGYRASLALADEPRVRQTYAELREKHGFRILTYNVDSDAASPRVCFQFSESLARKADFAPYVSVAGTANAAISVEDQQLCVEGLKHGERYAMVVRQGLPSSVGESLLKSADYDVYVRDRSPQVRFTGKNYVLPRVGQEGIPILSVNTAKVAIDILRIGDRSIAPTVRGEDFLKQLSSYRAAEIARNEGVKVWSGTLDVRPEQNRDVVTAFPILEAAPKLEAGVYVMLARAGERKDEPATSNADADSDFESDGERRVTQWFIVSDLGLTAFTGGDGAHVLVRSLASAQPRADVEVRLVARNNEILGTTKTDAEGRARFDPGLTRGTGGMAPGVVVASDASGDYGFLDLGVAAFDLTDRGVSGRAAPKGLDAFLYAERGVYRSNETVYVTTLLRDGKGAAVTGLPLTLVAKRPDGVEFKRAVVEDQGLGGRAWSVTLMSGAATGTWRVQAFADPKGPAIGEVAFLVEDYMPERLDVKVTPRQKALRPGEPAEIDVQADFLYGAPGAGLEVTGEVIVQAAGDGSLPGYAGFVAGVADESFENVTGELSDAPQTDARGRSRVVASVPEATAARPLEAKIVLRVGEPGGRAVERVTTIPIRAAGAQIGVKNVSGDNLAEGSTANFDLVAIGSGGERVARRAAQWTLSRIERRYQWFNSDGKWGYEPVKSSRRIADGQVDIGVDQFARISAQVGWGEHRLDVKSADGEATTSLVFQVGWSGEATAETPDLLEVTLDKKDYRVGETAKLTVKSRFSGHATAAIVGDGVREWRSFAVAAGETQIELPVKAEWGAGAYALVSAHRPLDKAANRMPGRALGLAWFAVDPQTRRLDVAISTPPRIRPRSELVVPVKVSGLEPGEEAAITIAAVDLGILNLTRFETPAPSKFYFGQRQIATEVRDLYGYLIDGMQGARGQIRSGGDAGAKGLEGDRPTQEPLARYSGVVRVGPDGTAQATFEIPAFNGAVRVMAVAWSKGKVGSAQADVIIRDPVVVAGTLPRFLSLGDRSRLHLQIDNVEGQAGDYVVDLDLRGPLTASADALRKTVTLARGQRTAVTTPVIATGVGTAIVDLRLTGPGLDVTHSYALKVQPGTSDVYRRTVRSVAPGESVTIAGDILADFLPRTGAVSVSMSPFGSIDVPGLLKALDRYPYGCSEQIVSRAMPLLYVNRLASIEHLALDGAVEERVKGAIERVLTRQDSNGDFGLWSAGGSEDMWLNAYVTDFLTRAREQGYAVPQKSFDQALDRLRNYVANTSDSERGAGAPLAYAIYVLARNGRPVMGDLRYLADTKLASFDSPLSRAQLGAALAMLGDRTRAGGIFQQAVEQLAQVREARVSRSDYGSKLRDGAGALALIAEAGGEAQPGAALMRANQIVEEATADQPYTSTQEKVWLVLAAQALAKASGALQLTVDGQPHQGQFARAYRDVDLETRSVTLVNRGAAPAHLVVTTSGNPIVPEPAAEQGYKVERSFYRLGGQKLEGQTVKQNERLVVVLKVTESEARYARLLLVDKLPAGLEIDNPKLVEGGSLEGLDWLKQEVDPAHTEYRDDRFVAAFDRQSRQSAFFSVAYVVRAVAPGRYVLPPAVVEDMYRPERFGRTAFGTFEVTAAP